MVIRLGQARLENTRLIIRVFGPDKKIVKPAQVALLDKTGALIKPVFREDRKLGHEENTGLPITMSPQVGTDGVSPGGVGINLNKIFGPKGSYAYTKVDWPKAVFAADKQLQITLPNGQTLSLPLTSLAKITKCAREFLQLLLLRPPSFTTVPTDRAGKTKACQTRNQPRVHRHTRPPAKQPHLQPRLLTSTPIKPEHPTLDPRVTRAAKSTDMVTVTVVEWMSVWALTSILAGLVSAERNLIRSLCRVRPETTGPRTQEKPGN